jgi:hypothetical protein
MNSEGLLEIIREGIIIISKGRSVRLGSRRDGVVWESFEQEKKVGDGLGGQK